MYNKIEVSRIIQNLPNYDNVSGEIRKKLRDFVLQGGALT